MKDKKTLLEILPKELQSRMAEESLVYADLQEIRLRMYKPVIVLMQGEEFFLKEEGGVTQEREKSYCVSRKALQDMLEFVTGYSLYAFEDEVGQGYLTIRGGHRVGLAGRVLVREGEVSTMKNITCLNMRIAHEIKGCADLLLHFLIEGDRLCNTLLVSPPGMGKTTLLRDLIRQLSDGCEECKGMTVGVVDERSEIAASYLGIPQNDVGVRTDVLDGCPKAEGMRMLLRSMSPKVLAVDEIGGEDELSAMRYAMYGGCKILATVHGDTYAQLQQKPVFTDILKQGFFERIVVLKGMPGKNQAMEIYDKKGKMVYGGSM